MSGRSFKSVFMVASCAGAALGCYLVSLRVATERAALEDVETQIVVAQRDMRLLQTEIGTRGRLAQLERWNAKVLALSAPSADQFLNGGFELAKMTAPAHQAPVEAPVVLASAPAPKADAQPVMDGDSDAPPQQAQPKSGPAALMHQASLKRTAGIPDRVTRPATTAPVKVVPKPVAKVEPKPADKKAVKVATTPDKKTPAAKAAAKPKLAMVDPLAPLPAKASAKRAATARSAAPARTAKDSIRKQ